MDVIIRADASIAIGSGHVMRCLTIAKKLSENDCSIKFWMEPLQGNLISFVNDQGYDTILEPQQADMYIVDHYGLGIEWERMIRAYTKKIVVIDDLAREHDCDLILDPNIVLNYETRYDSKVPEHCVKVLGPKYLIMRDEFINARKVLPKRHNRIKNLLVFMGGTDPTNETMKILQALKYFLFEHVDIVVGNGNSLKDEIELVCNQRGYAFHCQIDYMAKLMLQADFAIGAGGATMWERCYVGLPSSATIVADNQRDTTIFSESLGVVYNLGWHEQVTEKKYCNLLKNINGINLCNMSLKCLEITNNGNRVKWLEELLKL